jgi:polar amino acid transport system permease protein
MGNGAVTSDPGVGASASATTYEIRAVPVRRPGRWVGALAVGVLAAMLVHTLLTNPRFEWGVVGEYFTSQAILVGLLHTLELTALAMVIGILLGVVLAVMRLSTNPVLTTTSWAYIWFFRGTPLLVQLVFWYNLSALFPRLSLGVPFGPELVSGSANAFITTYVAAILGLGLNEGAYMAEIVRGGILSVDEGQVEAAYALGLRRLQILRLIVLPQAMKVIIPPIGNQTISMLKSSSLVSVISVPELLFTAQLIYSRTYETIPLLIVASLWYLAVTSVLTVGQFYVERHYAKGSSRQLPPTPIQRLRAQLERIRLTSRQIGQETS